MINEKNLDWLMDNADSPIRYRVAAELLKDRQSAKKIEPELLENPAVQLWIGNLKPHNPPQHHGMEHGCFDFCLENALPKVVQLGLHGDMPYVKDAVSFYIEKLKSQPLEKPYRNNWNLTFIASFLTLAGIKDKFLNEIMFCSLDELYDFIQMETYDIYITKEERDRLTGVPKQWRKKDFIKPELLNRYGMCYPLIYDIISLYKLYELQKTNVSEKINSVIDYISTDGFHEKIADGYGIIAMGNYASGNYKYHGMGWDPKYPGWFDFAEYMENGDVPKLLFFAEHIVKYPVALKTKWFNDLLDYLEKYRTDNGTYIFPKEWLPEKSGYAVCGFHMSFGENRRKKIWLEIESTFYMQLLRQNI